MKYYLDLTLIPDAETPIYFLWEKLYQQIHLALVDQAAEAEGQKISDIGVSFPQYRQYKKHPLGKTLRLLSSQQAQLESIESGNFLTRLRDYIHCKSIKPVPDKITMYVCFSREHIKGNMERLARRRAKNLGIEYDQALAYFQQPSRTQSEKKQLDLPYVYLNSQTTGQRFPLFIRREERSQNAQSKTFNCYGLSKVTTVPVF
jgi:CRISPR-associated endonuclease Csy4